MNISPSNIFRKFLSLERYGQKGQALFAAVSINGLSRGNIQIIPGIVVL